MSKLEELIQQYCPDGVEWKPLKAVLKIKNGRDYKHLGKGPIPVYGSGGIMTYVNVPMYTKPSVLIPRKGSIDKLYYADTPFWNVDTVFYTEMDTAQVVEKYVYYVLQKEHLERLNTAGGVPSLTQSVLNEVLIPVPPLPVQEEIVRVLDTFTELQAELQKRKQQYNFYRDNLLTNYTSEQNVKEYCLGELFEFKNGLNASKEQFGHGKPIVNYVNVYKKNSIVSSDLTGRVELEASAIERYRVKRGDVFFTRTSETREEVGFASVLLENIEDCVFSGFVLRARPTTNFILPEFCKYCFATYKIRKQIIQSSTLTTRALTNGTSLSKVKIMIPPIEEQNRIVSILDRFDTLTNDLTSGLPAEMEKRRQQYEFYRDKLLTFKRKEA